MKDLIDICFEQKIGAIGNYLVVFVSIIHFRVEFMSSFSNIGESVLVPGVWKSIFKLATAFVLSPIY